MDLVPIKAKEDGGNHFQYYNEMVARERQRQASRRLKRVMKKSLHRGLIKASLTQDDGSSIEYTDKEDIEQACLDENFNKLSQRNNTPVMQSPLVEEIGYGKTTQATKDILTRQYVPPEGTNIYREAFLNELYKPKDLQQEPKATITTECFQQGWKRMKEYTSSGVSGLLWTLDSIS